MLGFSKGKMETNQIDWELYAVTRFLGRNRLLFEHHQEVLRDFLHFFSHLSTELHIFDVGCSAGFFLVILRELGFEKIEGTDISETFVSHARTKGLQCRTANVLNGFIPEEKKNKADVVLLMDILEHLPEPKRALENCRTLLKKDGIIYITVPIYDSLTERLIRTIRKKTRLQQAKEHDPTHIQAFSETDFYNLLKEADFIMVESKRLFCPIPIISKRKIRDFINLLLPDFWKGNFLRVVVRLQQPVPRA
jgi:2-polyprenyl-3-methyl-5-hydroxy-6-metoxy-1,4-benzoquinol methylase